LLSSADKNSPSRPENDETGYTSDVENRGKSKQSKVEKSVTMTEQQLADLESQLVVKIMKHFKDNYNYSPGEVGRSLDEIYYSPIGEGIFGFSWEFIANCNGFLGFERAFRELFSFSPHSCCFPAFSCHSNEFLCPFQAHHLTKRTCLTRKFLHPL
jgi:hypothetical protein